MNKNTIHLDDWDQLTLVREWVDYDTYEGVDRYDCFVLHDNGAGASLTAAAATGELDCGDYQMTAAELVVVAGWEDWAADIGAYDPDFEEEQA